MKEREDENFVPEQAGGRKPLKQTETLSIDQPTSCTSLPVEACLCLSDWMTEENQPVYEIFWIIPT